MLVGGMDDVETEQSTIKFYDEPKREGDIRVWTEISKYVTSVEVYSCTVINSDKLSLRPEETAQELVIVQNQGEVDQLDIEKLRQ